MHCKRIVKRKYALLIYNGVHCKFTVVLQWFYNVNFRKISPTLRCRHEVVRLRLSQWKLLHANFELTRESNAKSGKISSSSKQFTTTPPSPLLPCRAPMKKRRRKRREEKQEQLRARGITHTCWKFETAMTGPRETHPVQKNVELGFAERERRDCAATALAALARHLQ